MTKREKKFSAYFTISFECTCARFFNEKNVEKESMKKKKNLHI